MGTTDIEIDYPDQFGVTSAEIDQLLQSGKEMMPGYGQAINIRARAGVRLLFKFDLGTKDDTRDVSRSHVLLDRE